MKISSNTEAVRLQVETKIINVVGEKQYSDVYKPIVDNAITREDLVEPLAEGIKEYRSKKTKIKNITEIRNRVDRVSKSLEQAVQLLKETHSDDDFDLYTTEYQQYNKEGEVTYQRGDIVFGGMSEISRDLDRIMKDLKPLARYIATDDNKRFGDIVFDLIYREGRKETILFDAPVDEDMRSLTAKGVDIDMAKVPEKAKELWGELGKQMYAGVCNKYLATHLYNYRLMIKETRARKKEEAETLPKQWRAYAAEAFIEHMQDHESDSYAKFRHMLSGNFKYHSENTMEKEFKALDSKYKKNKRGDKWFKVSHEHANLGWVHFVAAQGNLNGMLFGDVGRGQVKATTAQYVKEVSWENIKRALNLIEFIQNDTRTAEELAREILYNSPYSTYFVEKVINRGEKALANYLDDTTAKVMDIFNSSELISRGG